MSEYEAELLDLDGASVAEVRVRITQGTRRGRPFWNGSLPPMPETPLHGVIKRQEYLLRLQGKGDYPIHVNRSKHVSDSAAFNGIGKPPPA